MDVTIVEFSSNDSRTDNKYDDSGWTLFYQFIPAIVLVILVVFCQKSDLVGDIFENLAIITCIDSATVTTTVSNKNEEKKKQIWWINGSISLFSMIFYLLLITDMMKLLHLSYVLIGAVTLVYIIYRIMYIMRG